MSLAQLFDVNRSLAEVGVIATVLILILGAFLVGVRHLLVVSMPEQIRQLREDHQKVTEMMRDDAHQDREHFLSLIHLQRTEFLAALSERDKILREASTDRDRTLKETIARLEQNCEQAIIKVMARLDAIARGEGHK